MSTLKVNTITPNSGDTVTISGSLTTTGKLTIGDASTDTVAITAEISSSIIPDATNTYDLGSPTKVWREIYVSSESLNFVDGAGNSTKFTKDNVDKIKSGKPIATIGGFESSTRTKAIFQDDDETTYKKLTVPGRIGQFISGTLVKDYNKSGSNSYVKKDGIDVYEWNSAKSMSFNSTHSFWNVENMSMDISEGGFYGLAVSGSTLASNLHNMANNTSGLFLTGSNVIVSGSTSLSGSTVFQGGDTTVSQSTDDTLIISGGNIQFEVGDVTSSFEITGSEGDTLNVSGGNVVFSSSFSQSGDAVFEGGTTTINGTAQTQSLIVSGGQIQFEVEDSGSSFEISGSEGNTLNVSGGNVVISSSFSQSGEAVFDGGTTTINGTAQTQSLIVSGGQIQFEVEDSGSSFEITGSEGDTLNVSGGNVVITSEFTQSGTSTFENGTSTFSGNTSTTESILSGSGIAAEVSGTLTADNVVLNQSNMIPVTSSQTLTYTGPKPYYVRSGSGTTFSSGPQQGLPIGSATYTAFTPGQNPGPAAGELTVTLPTAQIGMQFTIKNLHDYVLRDITAGNPTAVNLPSLKIKPQSTDSFYTGATGSFSMANGKGIINHSASAQEGDEAMIWSPSGSKWMIGSLVGTWIDEA